MAIQPYLSKNEVLKCEILISNVNKGLDELLIDAEINFELNRVPSAKFTFISSNPNTDEGNKLASDNIHLNDELTFNIYTDGNKKTLFKGIVKSAEKKYTDNSINIKIECKDKAYELTLPSSEPETNEQTFDDKLELFTKNLEVDSSLTGQEWGAEIISHNPSTLPWDYLLAYLDAVGMLVAPRNGKLSGINILETGTEKFCAENGTNIFSFSGKNDDSKMLQKVAIEYWVPASQTIEKTEAEQEAPVANIKLISLNENRFSQGTIQSMANAILKKSALRTKYGRVTTFGNLTAIAGDYITFSKVNDTVDAAILLISGERHTINDGSWKVEYSFGLENDTVFADHSNRQTVNPQSQIGQTNLVSGLQIGVVLQIESDPANEFRIKVRIPALAETGQGIWARLATLNASAQMGSFFIPNVNDEVIVGCLGNNPDSPIILGSVYSSALPPPFTIAAENYIKGFVTKEGTKVIMDDEKKTIELSTKKGNKLLITDDQKGFVFEDENKNKIVMNQDGITIESSKDIIMKAKGNIEAQGVAVSAKASGNMEFKGSIIKLN
jgi:phage baseplate assembly protein gpV